MVDFESAAAKLTTLDDAGGSQVSKLAQIQLDLEQRVADLEGDLKQAKLELKNIAEDQLPAAMAEHGVAEFKLADGSSISVSKFYSASIPQDKKDEAFTWLVQNDHGDLIKNQVATNFVRGQEKQAEQFATELVERGMAPSTKKWVEPMTLKAWVRESTEKGLNIPHDLFGVFIGEKSKITRSK